LIGGCIIVVIIIKADAATAAAAVAAAAGAAAAATLLLLQEGATVNNAQMASVPGHHLWMHFAKAIQARVAAAAAGGKDMWALKTTGPHVLTDVVRVSTHMNRTPGQSESCAAAHLCCWLSLGWQGSVQPLYFSKVSKKGLLLLPHCRR
jgi:hypothetical protein